MICDVQYFLDGNLQRNKHYIGIFILFSAIFEGDFLFSLIRKRKSVELLLDLIAIYKATNGIQTEKTENAALLHIRIPLYLQQLFYRLLVQFKTEKDTKYVITSEYYLLNDSPTDIDMMTIRVALYLSPSKR